MGFVLCRTCLGLILSINCDGTGQLAPIFSSAQLDCIATDENVLLQQCPQARWAMSWIMTCMPIVSCALGRSMLA